MYESLTYPVILRRMLDAAEGWARDNGTVIDTREGSLLRTALSPAAVELAQAYIVLDQVLNESFADTQTRDFLIRRCLERGISVEPATFAVRRGEFNIPVPMGARFSLGKLNYEVVAPVEGAATVFQLRCETAGNIGNLESGPLVPIDYIEGLTTARLTTVLIPGDDEEDTEHLRARYFGSLKATAFGGNIQDYVEKTTALDGVGGVKVYPVWQGGGTVRLVFISSQFQKPAAELVDEVQSAVDPEVNQGVGMGFAPIGHVVTVEGVEAETVDIAFSIAYQSGHDWYSVSSQIVNVIDQYFTELAREWDKVDWVHDTTATLVVRISQIEARLLGITGILDIADTTLNGVPYNYTLGADGIPVRGAVNVV